MALTRANAHELVDALDPVDIPTAVALLRQLRSGLSVRRFQGFDVFDGDVDLGARSADILRDELGGSARSDGKAHSA